MLILARFILPKGEDGFPAAPQAARNAGAAGETLRTQSAPSSKLARSGPAQEGGPHPHRNESDWERPEYAVAGGTSRPRKGPRLKCVGFILDHADTPAFCLLLNRGFAAEMSCVLGPSQETPHILMYNPPLDYDRKAFQAAIACVGRRSTPLSAAPGGVPSCNHLAGSHSGHYRLHHEPLRAASNRIGRRSGPRSPASGAAPGRNRLRRAPLRAVLTCLAAPKMHAYALRAGRRAPEPQAPPPRSRRRP